LPSSWAAAITSGFVTGVTMNSAPAAPDHDFLTKPAAHRRDHLERIWCRHRYLHDRDASGEQRGRRFDELFRAIRANDRDDARIQQPSENFGFVHESKDSESG